MTGVRARAAAAWAATPSDPSDPPDLSSARRAVLLLAIRLARRGTLTVAGVVGGLSAFVVMQYRLTFAEAMDHESLAALAGNPAVRSLFGVPVALDDAGGFTVWRTGTPMAILVGVWALLATTRIMRGEEDAGRWAMLLGGRLSLDQLVVRHLLVMLAAQVVVGSSLAVALIRAGTRTTGALFYASALTLFGMAFVGVAALSAQLVADRRLAAGLAGAALGASLLLRMIADGVDQLAWLGWLNPLGLVARVQPYAANRPLPLLVLAAIVLVVSAATVVAAGRRDAEAGLWSTTPTRPAHLFWMRSLPRFAARRGLRGLVGWSIGLGAYFALVGSLAGSMTEFLTENPRFAEMAAQAGVTGLDSVEGYTAALFGLLPIPVGIYAAASMSADAVDEAARRFALIFSLPVSRPRWALIHAGVVATSCGLLSCVAAFAAWIGAQAADVPLRILPALAGTLNAIPITLLCLGAALFGLGWAPRAVAGLGATPAVGGYLLLVLTDTFGWPGWVRAISPFDHMANVPVTPADQPGAALILLAAAGLAAFGIYGYARRDLAA